MSFSGPLPDPETLKSYAGLPAVLDHILTTAKDEQKERHWREREQLRIVRLGQTFALVLGLGAIIGSVVCACVGQPVPATALGAGGLGTIMTSMFVTRGTVKRGNPTPPRDEDDGK